MEASSANWTSLFLSFLRFFIKVKLGGLVSQLYKLAFQTYHDIPRGPIKVENSARWFMVLGVDDGDGDRHVDDVDHAW